MKAIELYSSASTTEDAGELCEFTIFIIAFFQLALHFERIIL